MRHPPRVPPFSSPRIPRAQFFETLRKSIAPYYKEDFLQALFEAHESPDSETLKAMPERTKPFSSGPPAGTEPLDWDLECVVRLLVNRGILAITQDGDFCHRVTVHCSTK
eukprot:GABV01013517.1.p1 GENE.GABV01013517.1~~GABV01013517.1.p1  ORF type:complete len:110 (-),score=10.37 GABV01013517.1:24-353(-)